MEGHMGPGGPGTTAQSAGHSHLQGSGWAGVDTGTHGVWFYPSRVIQDHLLVKTWGCFMETTVSE